jgi:hypothetical protein
MKLENTKKPTEKELVRSAVESFVQKNGGGIVAEYIYYKTEDPKSRYREPTRRGTLKGDKIGFTKRKYYASILVALTNWTLKDIAEKSEVSYGLLRKWKTEDDFKAEIETHQREFVAEIIDRVKTQVTLQEKAVLDFYEGNGPDPFKDTESPLNAMERALIDAPIFSDGVLQKLDVVAERISKKEAVDYPLLKGICDVISYAKTKTLLSHHPLIIRGFLQEIENLIASEKKLTEGEQRMAVHMLQIIRDEWTRLHDLKGLES